MSRYQCVTEACENRAIFDTNVCEECLIRISAESAANMGAAEHFICGSCGSQHSPEDFLVHLETCEEK